MMWKGTLLALVVLALTGLTAALFSQSTSPVQYFYDDLGRLTRVVDQNGNVATYAYDAVGNLLAITRSTLPASNGPVILSITPLQGPVGTTVTIRGQGFSTTPNGNAVRFNGTQALVSSATATNLVVTVPQGATTGPVSLTVGGQTVTSSTNFTLTKALIALTILPSDRAIIFLASQQFIATGFYSDGTTQDLTNSVFWSSTSPDAVPISNVPGSQGLATGAQVGSTTIIAVSGAFVSRTSLTVTPVPVSLAISPAAPSVIRGRTQQLTATVTFGQFDVRDMTKFATWQAAHLGNGQPQNRWQQRARPRQAQQQSAQQQDPQ